MPSLSAVARRTLPTGLAADVGAGALTLTVLALLGAPIGLVWTAVAPHVQVVLAPQAAPQLADPETGAFLGADLAFGVLVLVTGLGCGLVASRLGRRRGPGVVVGLVVGGLLAAYAAQRTGHLVGLDAFRERLRDPAARGTAEAVVTLRATRLAVLWPVAALAAFAVVTALRGTALHGTGASPGAAGAGPGAAAPRREAEPYSGPTGLSSG